MSDAARLTPYTDSTRIPPLGIGLWAAHAARPVELLCQLESLAPHHVDIMVDLRRPHDPDALATVLPICKASARSVFLYVICDDICPEAGLSTLKQMLDAGRHEIAGLLLTPAAYLQSYQPDGEWPSTVSPAELIALGREFWPDVAIGGGFPTYFTELNRCRPDPAGIDFLTHATSPIVHAADDHSVIETLECLPHIFDSARRIAPDKPYRVTTSAIGAWVNPYGLALTPNTERERRTLSDNDPRQTALFAAAWSLGYMVQAIGQVDSLTLSSIGQPFPIADATHRYPIFDVLRGLARGAGQTALRTTTDHPALTAFGWAYNDGRGEIWLANLSEQSLAVSVDGARAAAILDDRIAMPSLSLDEWPLDRLEPISDNTLQISPYAVARVEINRP